MRPVLLLHGSRKAQRAVQRVLAAIQRPVLAASTVAEASASLAGAPELLVIEHATLLDPEGEAFLARATKLLQALIEPATVRAK